MISLAFLGILLVFRQVVQSLIAKVGQTRFSACVVLAHDAETFTDVWDTNLPQSFVYHRLDLRPQPSQCSFLLRVALNDKTTVKFAPTAFVDQYKYLDTEETKTTVDRYELYMLGKTNPVNPDFKEGVRESVASTHQLDAIVSTRPARYSIWRYIGTEAGVFRKYPGTRMVKEYDHTQRPWYKRGINRKGLATFSIPYMDASGAGIVLTLSHSIYQGRASHTSNDPVSAVMGMDFTLPYLYYRMLDTYPACRAPGNRCFLVDSSGFIVVHKDFVEDVSSARSDVHISTKEPIIAQDLVAKSIMKKAACVNVQEFSNQYFWTVSLLLAHKGLVSSSSYTLSEVPGSNVFVVIATGSSSGPPRECRWCNGSKALTQCMSAECSCPCFSPTDIYEYCKDSFSLQVDGWPVCVPQPAVVSLEDLRTEESGQVAHLAACFNYSCHANMSMSVCISTSSCTWCTQDGDTGETLQYPYCNGQGACRNITQQDYAKDDSGGSSTVLQAILIPLTIVFVIAGVGCWWWWRRARNVPPQPATNPEATATETAANTNTAFQMDESRPPPTAPTFVADPAYTFINHAERDLPNIYTGVYDNVA
ncbi:VWFA domain-containing protein [Lamellibrachia satsuma]|nr:VWFA domain-containing protein [Lamellibrachia satsuma]